MTACSIEDHALIGDTRTAALVTSDGTIDWMCVPRFDGDPIFGRLVDDEHGGVFRIAVGSAVSTERAYHEGSAVLRTSFSTDSGKLDMTDALVANVSETLLPQTLLVRHVEARNSDIELDVTFDPRLGLPGRLPDRIRTLADAVICEWGSLAVALQCDRAPVQPSVTHKIALRAGESVTYRLSIADRCPVTLVTARRASDLVAETDTWWRDWSEGIDFPGPYREMVVRSLITLRLLTYSPSGAPVAAPTTSLPESIGRGRNWDYRYAWPRDASIGLVGFLKTGKAELARSFMHWLMHASRLTRPGMKVLYDLFGKPTSDEREVEVSGYRASRPVRVGNGASSQHQLDVYGWVIDAASLLAESNHRLDGETLRALAAFADQVATRWSDPDAGIWEVRGRPRHYVHSKLMAWLALDRIGRMAPGSFSRSQLSRWEGERDRIVTWIHTHGVDRGRNTLLWRSGSAEVDASLLLLPVLGSEPEGSPLLAGTIDAVRAELEVDHGLLLRYRHGADDLDGEEGAFLACSFWLVQALALTGRAQEAKEIFGKLIDLSNDVGLYGEEIDPTTKEALGNFPQALTHATFVQAALALRESGEAS